MRHVLFVAICSFLIAAIAPSAVAQDPDPPKMRIELLTTATPQAGSAVDVRVYWERDGVEVPHTASVVMDSNDRSSTFVGQQVDFDGESSKIVSGAMATVGEKKIKVQWLSGPITGSVNRSVTVTTSPGQTARLVITGATYTTAGAPYTLTIGTTDAYYNVTTDSVDVITDLNGTLTTVSVVDGAGTVTLTPLKAGTIQVDAVSLTNVEVTGSRMVTVLPGPPASIEVLEGTSLELPTGIESGQTISVAALDAMGNAAFGTPLRFTVVSGDVTLDGAASLDVIAGEAGVAAVFPVAGTTTGPFVIEVESTLDPTVNATIGGEVARAVAQFVFINKPASVEAGADIVGMEIRAEDADGNLIPEFDEELTLVVAPCTGEAPNAEGEVQHDVKVAFTGGVGSVPTVNFKRAGEAAVTIEDPQTGVSERCPIMVVAGPIKQLDAQTYPAEAAPGSSLTLCGQLSDCFGNITTTITRTITLTITGAEEECPATIKRGPSLPTPRRERPQWVRLADGRVLVAGGVEPGAGKLNTTLIYTPATRTIRRGPDMAHPRAGHTMTLLPDGSVMVIGGAGPGEAVAELLPGDGLAFVPLPAASLTPRMDHGATALADGRVLVFGGAGSSGPLSTAEIYDPSDGSVAAGPGLPSAVAQFAVVDAGDSVFVVGGVGSSGPTAAVLKLDKALPAWTAVGSLAIPRTDLQAVLCDDDSIFVAAGLTGTPPAPVAEIEVFTISSGASAVVATMDVPRPGIQWARASDGYLFGCGGMGIGGEPEARTLIYKKSDGLMAGPLTEFRHVGHRVFPASPDSGEVVILPGSTSDRVELFRAEAARIGEFIVGGGGVRTTTVTTTGGKFIFELRVGAGDQEVLAESPGLDPVSFRIRGSGSPAALAGFEFSGMPTSIDAGAPYSPTIEAIDASGSLVPFNGLVQVEVEGSADEPDLMLVEVLDGFATIPDVLHLQAGLHRLRVSLLTGTAPPTASSAVDVLPAVPVEIAYLEGVEGQAIFPSSSPLQPIALVVRDSFGNGVAGVPVALVADAGLFTSTGTSTATVTTDHLGVANWPDYVGPAGPGPIGLTATTPGGVVGLASLTIESAVPADALEMLTELSSAAIGESQELRVLATHGGSPLAGVVVSVVQLSGTAALSSSSITTDASGQAVVSVSDGTIGRSEIRFTTAEGLEANATVVWGDAGVATSIELTTPVVSQAGTPFTVLVRVLDSDGELVEGSHVVTLLYGGTPTTIETSDGIAEVELVSTDIDAAEIDAFLDGPAGGGSGPTDGLLARKRQTQLPGPPAAIALTPSEIVTTPRDLLQDGAIARVVDAINIPVPNADINFRVRSGDSRFSPSDLRSSVSISDPNGEAGLPELRVGTILGTHELEVRVGQVETTLQVKVARDFRRLRSMARVTGSKGRAFRIVAATQGETTRPAGLLGDVVPGADPHLVLKLEEVSLAEDGSEIVLPVEDVEVEYEVLQRKPPLEDDDVFGSEVSPTRIVPAHFVRFRTKQQGSPVFDRTALQLPQVLGARATSITDVQGNAGLDLMLRIPRDVSTAGGIPYVAIRARIRTTGLQQTDDDQLIYLIIPIRDPRFELTGFDTSTIDYMAGTPLVIPKGATTAGAMLPMGFDKFPTIKLEREQSFGFPPGDPIPLPNRQVYFSIFALDGTPADSQFFKFWRSATSAWNLATPATPFELLSGGTSLYFMPTKLATATDYIGVVSLDEPAAGIPAAGALKAKTFPISVRTAWPADAWALPSFITKGAVQRLPIPAVFPGAPSAPTQKLEIDLPPSVDFTNVTGDPPVTTYSLALKDTLIGGACVPSFTVTSSALAFALEHCDAGPSPGFSVTEDPDSGTRVRSERAVVIPDARGWLVNAAGAPLDGPLQASDLVDPTTGAVRSDSAALDQYKFWVDVVHGAAGTADLALVINGMSLISSRLNESAALPIPSEPQDNQTLFSSTERLEERGVGQVRHVITAYVEVDGNPQHRRYGPFICSPQLYGAIKAGTYSSSKLPSIDGATVIGATDAIVYQLYGNAASPGDPSDYAPIESFRPRVHQVSALQLAVSTGEGRLPRFDEVRPGIKIDNPGAIGEGAPINIRVLDQLADATGAGPQTVSVTIVQEGVTTFFMDSFVVNTWVGSDPGVYTFTPGPGTVDWEKGGTMTVRVTNALGNEASLRIGMSFVAPLSSISTELSVLERTAEVPPAVLRAYFEPPAGTAPLPAWTVTLAKAGGASSHTLSMASSVIAPALYYRSGPVLLGRGDVPASALASLKTISLAEGDAIGATTSADPAMSPGVPGAPLTASWSVRPKPVFLVKDETGAFIEADVIRPGDEFKIRYRPDSFDPDQESIRIRVGPTDFRGRIDPTTSTEFTLVRTTLPGGELVFQTELSILAQVDPRADRSNNRRLSLKDEFSQIGFAATDGEATYSLPVFTPLRREQVVDPDNELIESNNLPEAPSGNSPQVGDGVYVHNQEQVLSLDLHTVQGRGLSYSLSITHRSRIDFMSVVGRRWTHNYDLRMLPNADASEVEYYDGTGRTVTFTKQPSGAYEPEAGFYAILAQEPDGSFTLTTTDKTILTFAERFGERFRLIKEIRDPNNNTMSFDYHSDGRLREVRDPYDRRYQYLYGSEGLLREVVDFRDRRITFTRFPEEAEKPFGLLEGVLQPRVYLGLANGVPEDRSKLVMAYDDSGRLESLANTLGRVFHNIYADSRSGRIKAQMIGPDSTEASAETHPAYEVSLAPRLDRGVLEVATKTGRRSRAFRFGAAALKGDLPLPPLRLTVPSLIKLGMAPVEETKVYYNHHLEAKIVVHPRGHQTIRLRDDMAPDVLRRGNVKLLSVVAAPLDSALAEVDKVALAGYDTYAVRYREEIKRAIRASHLKASREGRSQLVTSFEFLDPDYPAHMTAQTTPEGARTDYTYDDGGNLEQRTLPITNGVRPVQLWTYNAAGQVKTFTNELGHVLENRYFPGKPRSIGSYSYTNPGGTLAEAESATPENTGYLAKVLDLARSTEQSWERSDSGMPVRHTNVRGFTSLAKFDRRDRQWSFRPIGVNATDANVAPSFLYLRDGMGHVVRTETTAIKDAKVTIVDRAEFDSRGRGCLTARVLDSETEATQEVERKDSGLPTLEKDPEGVETAIVYNDKLRPIKRTVGGSEAEGSIPVRTRLDYDDFGDLQRTIVGEAVDEGAGSSTTQATWVFRDGFGRSVARLSPGACGGMLTIYGLDEVGRPLVTEVYGPLSDYDGDEPGGLASKFSLSFGRVARSTKQYVPRGWVKQETLVSTCLFSSTPDPFPNNLTKADEKAENVIIRSYSYDLGGRILSTDSKSPAPTLGRIYDAGRLQQVVKYSANGSPLLTTHFVYDDGGLLLERREVSHVGDKKTFTTTQTWDALGRLKTTTVPGAFTTTITYDFRSNIANTVGPQGTREFKYDLANRPTSETVNGLLMSRTEYFRNGMVKRRQTGQQVSSMSAGSVFSYWPKTKLLKSASHSGVITAWEYETKGNGKLVRVTDPNGTVVSLSVDDAGRVLSRSAQLGGSVENLVAAPPQTFCYDAIGRLVNIHEAQHPFTKAESWIWRTYDGMGRMCYEGQAVKVHAAVGDRSNSLGDLIGAAQVGQTVERLMLTTHHNYGKSISIGTDSEEADVRRAHMTLTYFTTGQTVHEYHREDGFAGGWFVGDKMASKKRDKRPQGAYSRQGDGRPMGYSLGRALGGKNQHIAEMSLTYTDARQVKEASLRLAKFDSEDEGLKPALTVTYGQEYDGATGHLIRRSRKTKEAAGSASEPAAESTTDSTFLYSGGIAGPGLSLPGAESVKGPRRVLVARERNNLYRKGYRLEAFTDRTTTTTFDDGGHITKLKVHTKLSQVNQDTQKLLGSMFTPAYLSANPGVFPGAVAQDPAPKKRPVLDFTTTSTRAGIDADLHRLDTSQVEVDNGHSNGSQTGIQEGFSWQPNGNLYKVRDPNAGSSGAPYTSYLITWDAYNRPVRIEVDKSRPETVYRTFDKPGGSSGETITVPFQQTVRRRSTVELAYATRSMRLLKASTTNVTADALGDAETMVGEVTSTIPVPAVDVTIECAEWTTIARGSVAEETHLVSRTTSGSQPQLRSFHNVYVCQGRRHVAIHHWSRSNAAPVAPFSLTDTTVRGSTETFYVVRDVDSRPLMLVDSNGNMEADYRTGYDGKIQEIRGRKYNDFDSIDGPRYHFQTGFKTDPETGFSRHGVRDYWAEIQQFTSPDPAGWWHDATAYGNPYIFAAGNSVAHTDESGEALGTIALVWLVGSAVYAQAMQTDAAAKFSPLHTLYSGAIGKEPFSGKSITTRESYWRIFTGAAGTLSGAGGLGARLFGATAGQAHNVSNLLFMTDNLIQGARSASTGSPFGVLLSVVGFRAGLRDVVRATSRVGALQRIRQRMRNPAGGGKCNCFVAGTKVQTEKHGAVDIEKIKAGKHRVLSRDPRTGKMGYKDVLQTFKSYPDHLITMSYRRAKGRRRRRSPVMRRATKKSTSGGDDGGPGLSRAEETRLLYADHGATVREEGATPSFSLPGAQQDARITGTAGHPLWSIDRQRWVDLGALRPGERLSLSDGSEALVTSLEWTIKAAGTVYTTYNLEVANWHNYFVSDSPSLKEGAAHWVWVHNNSGDAVCRHCGVACGYWRMPNWIRFRHLASRDHILREANMDSAQTAQLYKRILAGEGAPVAIPKHASVLVRSKNKHMDVRFTWRTGSQRVELRWHTRTSGAPPTSPAATWRLDLTTGVGTTNKRKYVMYGARRRLIPWGRWGVANDRRMPDDVWLLRMGHYPAPYRP